MDERTEYCISAELRRARSLFPSNAHMMTALMEEVGELAQALLKAQYSNDSAAMAAVYAEAIQVATMAIRVAEEGSAEFRYRFEHAHYQAFPIKRLTDG